VRAGTFSKSAHPNDDAKQGRLSEPRGSRRSVQSRRARASERSVGGGELNFSSLPRVPGAAAHPSIFFSVGWPWLSLSAKKFSAFFAVMVQGRQPNKTLFSIMTDSISYK